jgi:hypothetical protein
MHLQNILQGLGATIQEKDNAIVFFADKIVTYQGVRDYLLRIRNTATTLATKS